MTDNIANSEEEALDQIKSFLSYFPQNIYEIPPVIESTDSPKRSESSLSSIIPKERNKSYEMRDILNLVFDKESFFEMTNFYGRGIITGFARLNGFSFGVFANDSNFYAGSMTADNAKKTSRFVKLCDTFHLPIITFVDGNNPYVLAWPSSESGALPLEGGVAVAFAKEIASADNPDKKRKEIEEEMAKKQNPFSKAESFSVHEIIDPSETRKYLCGWIEKVQPQLKARLHIK